MNIEINESYSEREGLIPSLEYVHIDIIRLQNPQELGMVISKLQKYKENWEKEEEW